MSKILVIDDEEWLREMVHIALQERGFEVIEAENGAIGIELARSHLPDLVLCDVNMGKVDGYLTLSSLRNEPLTASIPFILMTGLADNAGMRHGMELGADDYLPKPFTLDALYAAVDARLKKSELVRHEAERKLAHLRSNITMMLPHELRTPLNGILAYGEMLASDAASLSAAEVAEMGKVVADSGRRLERLIENFLIYAQIELLGADHQRTRLLQESITPFASRIISNEAKHQADQADRSNDLLLDVADCSLAISEEYLSKIVAELVQNALRFSSTGTPVLVSLVELNDCVRFSVSDHGRGFSPEHIAQVGAYMQFDRKMHEQQGVGLGLGIAKRLAELHGGTLSISSTGPGSLTTVTVKLPACR